MRSRDRGGAVAHDGAVTDPLLDALRAHVPHDDDESVDLARIVAVVEAEDDPWSRDIPLHVTGSALVLDPPSGRVLLRWHAKQERWLQVGGHGDPGERDPWLVALREAEEETGLTDLTPLTTRTGRDFATDPARIHAQFEEVVGRLFQVTIVPVKAAKGEGPHEHADLRYLLATARPADVPAAREGVALRWFSLQDALAVADEGLARLLRRIPGVG
jgi:8-oxo-dGTP pyrophosphatase MutT (NUDIX family)